MILLTSLQVDTIAKRLMSNYGRVTSASQLNTIIFKDKAAASIPGRFFSLFPGLGYAAAYKVCSIENILPIGAKKIQVLQRIYKYGGQPFVRDILAQNYGADFDRTFGPGNGKAILHATAGRYDVYLCIA